MVQVAAPSRARDGKVDVGDDEGARRLDFDEFYRREFAGMVALAAAITGARAGAEDVAQDAMADAHRRWDRVGGYDLPRAWVRRVVVQRSMKVRRKQDNERRAHLRAVPGVAEPTTSGAVDSAVLAALRSLPARQRAVVALHYLEDLPVREVAELLGITEGSVKTHLSRARSSLAAALGHERSEMDR